VKVFIEHFIQGANARDRVFFAINDEGKVIQVIESDSRRVIVVYDEPAQAEETGCTAIYISRALMLAHAQANAAKSGGGLVGADGVPVAKG
jgi:hypothetical protein